MRSRARAIEQKFHEAQERLEQTFYSSPLAAASTDGGGRNVCREHSQVFFLTMRKQRNPRSRRWVGGSKEGGEVLRRGGRR